MVLLRRDRISYNEGKNVITDTVTDPFDEDFGKTRSLSKKERMELRNEKKIQNSKFSQSQQDLNQVVAKSSKKTKFYGGVKKVLFAAGIVMDFVSMGFMIYNFVQGDASQAEFNQKIASIQVGTRQAS